MNVLSFGAAVFETGSSAGSAAQFRSIARATTWSRSGEGIAGLDAALNSSN
jgi:hypothetical protein